MSAPIDRSSTLLAIALAMTVAVPVVVVAAFLAVYADWRAELQPVRIRLAVGLVTGIGLVHVALWSTWPVRWLLRRLPPRPERPVAGQAPG